MRVIFLFIFFGLIFSACTKEADNNVAKAPEYKLEKNLYRVAKIEGHNSHWGEFTLVFNYKDDMLNTSYRMNPEGDTTGYIRPSYDSKRKQEFTVYDLLHKIDADSIVRLDNALKEKYGEGNYSLKDSIPLVSRAIQRHTLDFSDNGLVKRHKVFKYKPREDVGAGEDFDNSYILTHSLTNTYEYDENADIIVNRVFSYTYDEEDSDIYTFEIYKYEMEYKNRQILSMDYSTVLSGENYKLLDRFAYSYANKQLQSVIGEKQSWIYEGNTMKASGDIANAEMNYKFDENGNVIEISDKHGNLMKITYEAGHGNMSALTPILDRLVGMPYIK